MAFYVIIGGGGWHNKWKIKRNFFGSALFHCLWPRRVSNSFPSVLSVRRLVIFRRPHLHRRRLRCAAHRPPSARAAHSSAPFPPPLPLRTVVLCRVDSCRRRLRCCSVRAWPPTAPRGHSSSAFVATCPPPLVVRPFVLPPPFSPHSPASLTVSLALNWPCLFSFPFFGLSPETVSDRLQKSQRFPSSVRFSSRRRVCSSTVNLSSRQRSFD